MKKEIYPLTIIMSRYGGTYSGGKYVAFNETNDSGTLDDAIGDDCSCAGFFSDIENPIKNINNIFGEKIYCGRGDTPNEALEDLAKKLT